MNDEFLVYFVKPVGHWLSAEVPQFGIRYRDNIFTHHGHECYNHCL